MRRLISVIALLSVFLFFVSYVTYHIIQQDNNQIQTETAFRETVFKTIETQCFIVRDEKMIKSSADGTKVSFVKNGDRVAGGDTVAVVFDSSDDAVSYLEINELEKDIEHYEQLSGQANFQTLNINSVTKKINNELNDYLDALEQRDFSAASEYGETFRDSVTGKQIATGTELDFSEKLADLKNSLNELKSQSYSCTTVKTGNAGYFISGSDGYEKKITFSDIDSLTADDVSEAIKSKPDTISDNIVGRTVGSFSWYITCVIDSDESVDITYNKDIYLNFPESGIEKLPVTLHKIESADNGKTLVVFSCDEMNENLCDFRIEKIEIITDEYTGLKISNSSIRVVDGEKGVYIVRGNLMGFRKINILYSTEKYSIVDNPDNASDYIKLYDQVVTEGVELYDNKLV